MKESYLSFLFNIPGGFVLDPRFFVGEKEETMTVMSNSIFSTRSIAKCAILSAIAFILMFFDFPLPFAPSFYQLDFSELPVMLGAFAMGPMAGVVIEAVKVVLNLLFTGSDTAYVGELANFIIGVSFVVPAAMIYRHHKTKNNAIIGMVIGTICMTLMGCVFNYFILLPMYSVLYQLPMEAIIGMGQALIPLITDTFTFVCFAVVPFNIFKGIVISLITTLVYKHVSPLLHR